MQVLRLPGHIGSSSGISIEKHCSVFLYFSSQQSTLSVSGVRLMSWSRNCPHSMCIWVKVVERSVELARALRAVEILLALDSGCPSLALVLGFDWLSVREIEMKIEKTRAIERMETGEWPLIYSYYEHTNLHISGLWFSYKEFWTGPNLSASSYCKIHQRFCKGPWLHSWQAWYLCKVDIGH